MSGGVDSSVAACLLHEQGHDVIGVFMRLGAEPAAAACEPAVASSLPIIAPRGPDSDRHRGCCSALDATDARTVAGRLGFPFYALNFEKDFSRLIDYFADEYAAARTPNPCVMCNQQLKFGRLVAYADAIGADFIATGHYARVDHSAGRPRLLRARHLEKDQSYVLFGIAPDVLSRTLFPLGDLTKDEVRALARRFGLSLHDKPESQDICFVPDRDYARVVRQRRPESFVPGEMRHVDGRVLRTHDGVAQYTVGQRHGLGVALGAPVYVSQIERDTGAVIVGPADFVRSATVRASRISWFGNTPESSFRADVRIRYNHTAAPGEISPVGPGQVHVRFDEPQWAVTPGQAVVFYSDDEVLGGGWIDSR